LCGGKSTWKLKQTEAISSEAKQTAPLQQNYTLYWLPSSTSTLQPGFDVASDSLMNIYLCSGLQNHPFFVFLSGKIALCWQRPLQPFACRVAVEEKRLELQIRRLRL